MNQAASTKAVKTAISPTRADNYAEWYQQVIRGADMAELSGVRGCMVIKPWGYGIWERLVRDLDQRIKDTGHDNCYFPLFIPLSLIAKEAAHVDGFAKEMAIVTHHRLEQKDGELVLAGELEEPLVVRPTSETIIGEAFAKWIQSYRDLPVLINQWANVVRWEMRPRLFLRTVEFLWQEGHTAHANKAEAMAETMKMLQVYKECVQQALALPVIAGEKTAGERFPGAENTFTIEAMMQDGKALQAGTSHYLGQNFAKAANIRFQTKAGELDYAYTTSWGVSTRLIGGMIMAHADDDGLRTPPRLAPQQVVIVPVIRADADASAVIDYAQKLAASLRTQRFADEAVRVKVDTRELSGADKKWEWIKKGVPLIVEVGPRDIANDGCMIQRRDQLSQKIVHKCAEFVANVAQHLADYQAKLFADVEAYQRARTVTDIKNLAQFTEYFSQSGDKSFGAGQGFVHAPWAGDEDKELFKKLGISIRCVPLEQAGASGGTSGGTCVLTGKPATQTAIFARSY